MQCRFDTFLHRHHAYFTVEIAQLPVDHLLDLTYFALYVIFFLFFSPDVLPSATYLHPPPPPRLLCSRGWGASRQFL